MLVLSEVHILDRGKMVLFCSILVCQKLGLKSTPFSQIYPCFIIDDYIVFVLSLFAVLHLKLKVVLDLVELIVKTVILCLPGSGTIRMELTLYVLSESAELLCSQLNVLNILQHLEANNAFNRDDLTYITEPDEEHEKIKRLLDGIYQKSLSHDTYDLFMEALKEHHGDLYSKVKDIELKFESE